MMTVLPPSITQSSDTKPPQPLDDTLLHAFAVETNALLTGAKCQKIHQLTPYDFVLSVWQPNPTQCPILAAHQHLLITLRKDAPFVCWLNATEFQQLQSLYGTGRNTPLVALLRKQLLGARLENIACIAGEPILHLHLTTTNDLGFKQSVTLILELMGRFTNLILVESGTQKIIGLFNVVTETMSRLRQLRVGGLYASPPTPNHKPLLTHFTNPSHPTTQACYTALHHASTKKQWVNAIQTHYWGCSKVLLQTLADYHETQQLFAHALTQWLQCPPTQKSFVPLNHHQQNQFIAIPTAWLQQPYFETMPVFPTVNNLLKTVFFAPLQQQRFTQQYKTFAKPLHQAQRLLLEQLEAYQANEHLRQQAEAYQAQADWLMTLLSMNLLPDTHPPAEAFTLPNPFDETTPITFIQLQPAKTWKHNSQWLYKQVQKLNSRATYYASQLASLTIRQQYLNTLQVHLENVATLAEFEYLRPDWEHAGLLQKTEHQQKTTLKKKQQKAQKLVKKPEKPTGIHTVLEPIANVEVWVGKSSQANGYLAGKALRAEDWWFHAGDGIASSHVVLRSTGTALAGINPLPDETLAFVAGITAYHSSAKHSAKVPVIYTLGKFVRPIPNSYPGHVNHVQERTILISPQKPE